MALITCKNLSLGYDGQVLVKKVNFTVNQGDYICIVGENGSGKSTLMKTILGLQKQISGKITFDDGLKQTQIGYLPQQTIIQKDFPASVWEVVLSGTQNQMGLKPFYTKKEKTLAKTNIEKMGLSGFEKRCFRDLSGGQQQRVLLARALCASQKILLLDEPVAGLDPKVTKEMYKIIKKLNDENITIIMISHDIKSVISQASHILHITSSVFFGTKEEYLDSELGKQFVGGAL